MSIAHSLKTISFAPLKHQRRFFSRTAVKIIAVVLLVILNCIGSLIVARRFVGALSQSLSGDIMLLTALGVLSVASFVRLAWRRFFPLGESPAADWAVGYGSSLALGLWALGLCYPAYNSSDWLIWLPMLVADQFWRQTFFDAGTPGLRLVVPEQEMLGEEKFEYARLRRPTNQSGSDEQIVQQLFRVRDAGGGETVYGTFRADFSAGQRTATVHVSFCPPLDHLPDIEAEALPGYEASVKVVQAFAHGTRLDVRNATCATEDCYVWIDLAARPVPTKHGS